MPQHFTSSVRRPRMGITPQLSLTQDSSGPGLPRDWGERLLCSQTHELLHWGLRATAWGQAAARDTGTCRRPATASLSPQTDRATQAGQPRALRSRGGRGKPTDLRQDKIHFSFGYLGLCEKADCVPERPAGPCGSRLHTQHPKLGFLYLSGSSPSGGI